MKFAYVVTAALALISGTSAKDEKLPFRVLNRCEYVTILKDCSPVQPGTYKPGTSPTPFTIVQALDGTKDGISIEYGGKYLRH